MHSFSPKLKIPMAYSPVESGLTKVNAAGEQRIQHSPQSKMCLVFFSSTAFCAGFRILAGTCHSNHQHVHIIVAPRTSFIQMAEPFLRDAFDRIPLIPDINCRPICMGTCRLYPCSNLFGAPLAGCQKNIPAAVSEGEAHSPVQ